MTYLKTTLAISFSLGALLLTGCGDVPNLDDSAASPGAFIYAGRNFGTNRNETYKQGVMDGCKTSQGTYTKNHGLFNGNGSYHNGWEHGRIHCNPDDKAKYYSLVGK